MRRQVEIEKAADGGQDDQEQGGLDEAHGTPARKEKLPSNLGWNPGRRDLDNQGRAFAGSPRAVDDFREPVIARLRPVLAGPAFGPISSSFLPRCRALAALLVALLLAAAPLPAAGAAAQAQEAGGNGASGSGDRSRWFTVERLNAGLPPPPDDLERATPRAAFDAFLDAARNDDWRRAAHLLDLSELPEERQAERGPELARQLAAVIERKLWIDWSDLPGRPDALLVEGAGNDPLAGQPRRSLELAVFDIEDRPVALRLTRVKPAQGEPVWLFSKRTLRYAPQLYASFGPGWLERRLPDSWRQQTVLSLYRWELAALPVLLLAVATVLLLTRRLLGWLGAKLPMAWARRGAWAARTPLALVAAAVAGELLLSHAVSFSGPITTVLSPVMFALIVVGLTLAALRAIDAGLNVVTERFVGEIDDSGSRDQRHFYTSIYAARRVVVLLAFVAGLGIVLSQFELFQSIGVSLLASAGVLTVVLGIAGQTVLGNILASLQIALAKPIRIGDSVLYEGHWAYVEAIYYTFVRLRTWDERRLIVPVKYFVSNPFENWSMNDAKMTRTFRLHLDHAADVQALRERYEAIAREDEDVMPEEMLKVLVVDHGQNAQVVQFYATAPDPTTAWNMHARLREAILAWIRDNHPDWWPRERVMEAGRPVAAGENGQRAAAAD